MVNLIVLLVILAIISGASYKIYSDKKKGVKCVGCPYSPVDGKPGQGCSCK